MTCPFEVVGMFGTRPGGGSPLAVVHDADGLDDTTLRRMSGLLRTDETVFVLPPTTADATHRVRVFTARGESPHGGHSAVGTAVALVRSRRLAPGRVVQQCGESLLELEADARQATVTAAGPWPSRALEAGPLLDAVGLRERDRAPGSVLAAGFGPLFHLLPVRADAVSAARPDEAAMAEGGLPDVFVFHWDEGSRTATARLFAPGYAIGEDPACASVALALGVWLADRELTSAQGAFRIEQGAELGRPAVLEGTISGGSAGGLTVTVTGQAPRELAGHLAVPAPDPTAA
ncbi:PhzF family phenazine biosynthesis protein [Streptomyces sp. JJ66]|uniref:PhzF family phenazine biosynthesis protein n=1 Tax=Streptomyces sp. JJ66 TaxID=2803843 RepID=UPI001C584C98|nr:PhzF family phenazine biosynthesis isomerase [Streptomyces sp. JJ66]MBW1600575.1 PhzF family phenazine biosynthesis protein [Streptomyces sp. JJ66]